MIYQGHKGFEARAAKALKLITACAEEGRVAPSNAELAELLEYDRVHSSTNILKALEKRGAITVMRFNASRIITVTSTGKSTGGAPGTIHWTRTDGSPRADVQPQREAAPVVRSEPEPVRINRDPCTFCGIRADVGCGCSRTRRPVMFVPVSHFAEVIHG